MLNRGKWSQPGVPHKGWSCDHIDDLGEPSAICETCETQEIRYVHFMEHPNYPEVLECGCVCAGHMEEDPIGARRREQEFRNISLRRRRWLTREWRTSYKGNSFLNVDGYNVVVFPAGNGWRYRISGEDTLVSPPFPSQDAAKLQAFNTLFKPGSGATRGD
jgi:hypothetical protein